MARMFRSKMMSSGSNPSRMSSRYARSQTSILRPAVSAWPALVEGHHDDRRAVAADGPRLAQELVLALLETDRVGDRLALDAGQPGFDHRPLRAVHHDRQPGDFRLGGHHVEERGHRRFRVEHPLVHVDVEDVGAAAHLLERDRRGVGVLAVGDQPREALRSGDVGPLADQDEVRVWPDGQRLEAGILGEAFGIDRIVRIVDRDVSAAGDPSTASAIARM